MCRPSTLATLKSDSKLLKRFSARTAWSLQWQRNAIITLTTLKSVPRSCIAGSLPILKHASRRIDDGGLRVAWYLWGERRPKTVRANGKIQSGKPLLRLAVRDACLRDLLRCVVDQDRSYMFNRRSPVKLSGFATEIILASIDSEHCIEGRDRDAHNITSYCIFIRPRSDNGRRMRGGFLRLPKS